MNDTKCVWDALLVKPGKGMISHSGLAIGVNRNGRLQGKTIFALPKIVAFVFVVRMERIESFL
jgi:hypothetical protein